MSGKPWPDGVTQAMALIQRKAALEAEASKLRPQVARLEKVEEEWATAAEALQKLLTSMDISADQKGNWGWEGRFAWFLEEMVRQARAPQSEIAGDAPSNEVKP